MLTGHINEIIIIIVTYYRKYHICMNILCRLVRILVSCTIQYKNCLWWCILWSCIFVPLFPVAYEKKLRMLCLTHCGIDQLTIHPSGGIFCLGSGDATLIVDEGTVKMETIVRYAVILHGPFVYSAGYKPASVVVYLNLEGANLLKPLKLTLKHWCKPVEVSGALKLLRAPHTTGEMENFRYIFHEVQGVLLHNTATFTISEPQCLYCVEMEKESQASYNAIAFQKNLHEENLVMFRIQFMCDSLEWNAVSICTVLKSYWHSTVHVAAMFV